MKPVTKLWGIGFSNYVQIRESEEPPMMKLSEKKRKKAKIVLTYHEGGVILGSISMAAYLTTTRRFLRYGEVGEIPHEVNGKILTALKKAGV